MTPLIILKHEDCEERFRLEMVSKSIISSYFRLRQVRSGQVRSGQVRPGQVKSGQVRPRQVRLGQVKSGQVKLILSFLSWAN